MGTNIHVTKSSPIPESTEVLAASIVQISQASRKLLDSGLNRRALVTLIQEGVGVSKIGKCDIELVLDSLPRLEGWYVKKPAAK